MAFNNLDSFSQLLRERSYDDLEKQKLSKAISPRDKWCDETEDLLDDSLGLNESLFGGSPEKRLLRQMQRLQKKIDSCDDLAEKLELNKQILELANKRSSLFYNSMNMPLTEDYRYKAKIGDSYLKGNRFTTKASEADIFESETEPRQRINQMRKDGKHIPKGNVSVEKIKESRMKYSGWSDNVSLNDIFNIVGEYLEDYNFQKTTAKEPVPMTYRIQKVQGNDELSASVDGNYYDDIIVECNFSSHTGYSYIIITQDSGEQATWAGHTKSELRDDIVEAIKICLKTSKEHAGKKTFDVYLDELYDGDREAMGDFIDSISNIFKGDELRDLMTKYMTKEEFSKTYSDLKELNN